MSMVAIVGVSAGVVVGLLAAAQALSYKAPKRFLSTVILGEDLRVSTSKTFILLWTLLVAWALVVLLIAGELVAAHACISGRAAGALARCRGDDVALLQMGWTHFLHGGLNGSYLVLLGVPAAAGVAAKGITQAQAQSATVSKPPKTGGNNSLAARAAEIFSADDGSTDIGDFQYVVFNLIAATYFVARFLRPDINGLPIIPDTLLGLTGVSATLYAGKKAVTRNQPAVSGVFPSLLRGGQPFTVLGAALVSDPSAPTTAAPRITIDGIPVQHVTVNGYGGGSGSGTGSLEAIAPDNLSVAGGVVTRQLQVLNPYGAVTANFPVQCG